MPSRQVLFTGAHNKLHTPYFEGNSRFDKLPAFNLKGACTMFDELRIFGLEGVGWVVKDIDEEIAESR